MTLLQQINLTRTYTQAGQYDAVTTINLTRTYTQAGQYDAVTKQN